MKDDVDSRNYEYLRALRKDYDDLARRVKDLEKRVFAH